MTINLHEFDAWVERVSQHKVNKIEHDIFMEFVKIAKDHVPVGYVHALDMIDEVMSKHVGDGSKLSIMIRHNGLQVRNKLWSLNKVKGCQ